MIHLFFFLVSFSLFSYQKQHEIDSIFQSISSFYPTYAHRTQMLYQLTPKEYEQKLRKRLQKGNHLEQSRLAWMALSLLDDAHINIRIHPAYLDPESGQSYALLTHDSRFEDYLFDRENQLWIQIKNPKMSQITPIPNGMYQLIQVNGVPFEQLIQETKALLPTFVRPNRLHNSTLFNLFYRIPFLTSQSFQINPQTHQETWILENEKKQKFSITRSFTFGPHLIPIEEELQTQQAFFQKKKAKSLILTTETHLPKGWSWKPVRWFLPHSVSRAGFLTSPRGKHIAFLTISKMDHPEWGALTEYDGMDRLLQHLISQSDAFVLDISQNPGGALSLQGFIPQFIRQEHPAPLLADQNKSTFLTHTDLFFRTKEEKKMLNLKHFEGFLWPFSNLRKSDFQNTPLSQFQFTEMHFFSNLQSLQDENQASFLFNSQEKFKPIGSLWQSWQNKPRFVITGPETASVADYLTYYLLVLDQWKPLGSAPQGLFNPWRSIYQPIGGSGVITTFPIGNAYLPSYRGDGSYIFADSLIYQKDYFLRFPLPEPDAFQEKKAFLEKRTSPFMEKVFQQLEEQIK